MTKPISLGLMSLLAITMLCGTTSAYGQTERGQAVIAEWQKLLIKHPPRKGGIELELIASFPTKEQEDNGIYFVQGRHITRDQANNIYISDMRGNTIFKFDSGGQFLNKFGRAGQGPGDLSLPHFFHITSNNEIIVGETGNMRFQFLDSNGAYISSFKIFRGYISWITDKKGRIFAVPRLHPELKNIVEVLSPEGELLESFGEPLKFKYDMPIYNDANICINNRDEIFVGFKHIPLIRKYSLNGVLRNEIKLAGDLFEEKERSNIENQSRIERTERSFYKPIVCDLQSSAEGFIFMHNYPRLEFYEHNSAGEILKSYWVELSSDYMADSFSLILDKRGGVKFYVLQLYPESKVDIFIPKGSFKGGYR